MLGLLVAAGMAASFFMPWISILGEDMSPYSMLGDKISFTELPWRGWVFVASFALAAVGSIAGFFRRFAGVLMVVAGVISFLVCASQALR